MNNDEKHIAEDVECAFLGAILLGMYNKIDHSNFKADYFAYEHHKIIYMAMKNLYHEKKGIDYLTVKYEVQNLNSEWIIGDDYLLNCANDVPCASHINEYAEIIKEQYMKRNKMKDK